MSAAHMFIVRHKDQYHGPFRDIEAERFAASSGEGRAQVLPLIVPRTANEKRGPLRVWLMNEVESRTHIDTARIDSERTLAAILWEFHYARNEERVLTVEELLRLWKVLHKVGRALKSLMHYAQRVVEDPSPDHLVELRKAFWRNRDADDVDPDYFNRFW